MAALTLYGALLGSFAIVLWGTDLLYLQFTVQTLDAIVIGGFCIAFHESLWPLLSRSPNPRWYVIAAGWATVTFTVAAAMVGLLTKITRIEPILINPDFFQAGFGWPAIVFWTAVMPAIFEELAFRGVILESLTRLLARREAILVSAFMFAILHLSVFSLPHLVLIGAVLAWLRLRTGSLLPGMLLHFAHNLMCVVLEGSGTNACWSNTLS
jgi:uncharacterized protein